MANCEKRLPRARRPGRFARMIAIQNRHTSQAADVHWTSILPVEARLAETACCGSTAIVLAGAAWLSSAVSQCNFVGSNVLCDISVSESACHCRFRMTEAFQHVVLYPRINAEKRAAVGSMSNDGWVGVSGSDVSAISLSDCVIVQSRFAKNR